MEVEEKGKQLYVYNKDTESFEPVEYEGLTKREYFAGLAMQGLITLKGSDCMDMDITAKQCVRMADTLLSELDK